jgi:hypothetical protein
MGVESLVQITVLAAVTLGLHIYEFKALQQCTPAYNLLSLADMSSLFLFCVAIWIMSSSWQRLAKCLTSMSVVGLVVATPPALYLLIRTMVSQPKCIPTYLQKLDLSLLVFLALMEFVGLCVLGCLAAAVHREKRVKAEAKEEFERVYENILKPEYDLNEFFAKHGETIDKVGLSEKEIAILNDRFGVVFQEDQTNMDTNDKKECAICLGEFERGERLVIHPQCNHTFHSVCLGNWLKNDTVGCVCPYCKTSCRRAMLKRIRQTMFGDADNVTGSNLTTQNFDVPQQQNQLPA